MHEWSTFRSSWSPSIVGSLIRKRRRGEGGFGSLRAEFFELRFEGFLPLFVTFFCFAGDSGFGHFLNNLAEELYFLVVLFARSLIELFLRFKGGSRFNF